MASPQERWKSIWVREQLERRHPAPQEEQEGQEGLSECTSPEHLGSTGLGNAGLGSAGLGSAGLGSVSLGSVGLGSVSLGSAGSGSAGSGSPDSHRKSRTGSDSSEWRVEVEEHGPALK